MTFDFDLFVIGGGSGGVRAARVAAGEAGAKVGLAEDDRLGGTCVIRGCVPKKLMVFASGYRAQIEDAREYGWDIPGGETFRWPKMRDRLADELDRLENVYRGLLEGLASPFLTRVLGCGTRTPSNWTTGKRLPPSIS